VQLAAETTENRSMKKLLEEIRDLMKSRIHNEEEQRRQADKQKEMRKDWMLVAAVLDRICAIAITVAFVGGTVILFVVFVKHPWPPYLAQTRTHQEMR